MRLSLVILIYMVGKRFTLSFLPFYPIHFDLYKVERLPFLTEVELIGALL